MTSSRLHHGTVALLAALALVATATTPASAATASPAEPAFALSPVGASGALLLPGAPGRVLRGSVLVRNLSRQPVTVKLQAADIRNASNGNADYATASPSRTGSWLTLADDSVRLEARSSRQVPFTVSIPGEARGGSHYAGIVGVDASEIAAAAAKKTAKGKNFNFSRINRQALPLTIRLPGPSSRSLALTSAKLMVEPAGAGLMLGLLPGGSELIQGARIKLRVTRGARTILTYSSTLGQLFPGTRLNHRIAWKGRPTEGSYRVQGVIRPRGAATVNIDETVHFTPAKATQLEQETTPLPSTPGLPLWVWLTLATGATVLTGLSVALWKLAQRTGTPVA